MNWGVSQVSALGENGKTKWFTVIQKQAIMGCIARKIEMIKRRI